MSDNYDGMPTTLIHEIMRESANRVIGAYMSKAYKTDDPELEQELKKKVDRVWDIRAECDQTDRDRMIDIITGLREKLQEIRRGKARQEKIIK